MSLVAHMAEASSLFPPQADYLHPDGWLGMASDQGCAPSLCLAHLLSVLAGAVWHGAMMCANTQTAGRLTCCTQAFSNLLSFSVSFTCYVSFTSWRYHQFGSLDNQLQKLAPREGTWCWEGVVIRGVRRDEISCLLEVDISFHGLYAEPRWLDQILNF